MALDEKTVKKVAQLSRLKVAPEKLPQMVGEMNAILAFVEQLSQVDTTGINAMASVSGEFMPMRDDVVTELPRPLEILANAPDKDKNHFLVPKVVE